MKRVLLIRTLCIAILYLMVWHTQAQGDGGYTDPTTKMEKPEKKGYAALLINPFYSPLFPTGILSQRFGFSNNIGLNLSIHTRTHWLVGIEGSYLFGSDVKVSPIDSISTSNGGHIEQQATLSGSNVSGIRLALSGFMFQFKVSRVISLTARNPESGIMVSLGAGMIQHQIWINVNPRIYPQFDQNYRTGYDRMTNGGLVSAALGYFYISKNHKVCLYLAGEFNMGITQNRRAWNFDEGGPPTDGTRIDMLAGFRIGWCIPVKFRMAASREYY